MIKSALQIFERLELWEDAISCYQALGEAKKAEALVLRQLETAPNSPKLLCILGDLRSDPSLYEQAWEKSNHRFARAMRSLGAYYFKRNEFEKSIESYEKALFINPLFVNSWFVLGCAGMKIENWQVAAKAFSRAVAVDPEV